MAGLNPIDTVSLLLDSYGSRGGENGEMEFFHQALSYDPAVCVKKIVQELKVKLGQ